jgi:hypothetical protein
MRKGTGPASHDHTRAVTTQSARSSVTAVTHADSLNLHCTPQGTRTAPPPSPPHFANEVDPQKNTTKKQYEVPSSPLVPFTHTPPTTGSCTVVKPRRRRATDLTRSRAQGRRAQRAESFPTTPSGYTSLARGAGPGTPPCLAGARAQHSTLLWDIT